MRPIAIFGFYVGVAIYYLLGEVYAKLMLHFFDAEMMSSQDLIWMRNGDLNPGNWTIGVIYEKFEYENMRDYLMRVTENLHRLRCK